MKVPPKRKGNPSCEGRPRDSCGCLNESPSEKEGKCANDGANGVTLGARLNESPSEKEGKSKWFDKLRKDVPWPQ